MGFKFVQHFSGIGFMLETNLGQESGDLVGFTDEKNRGQKSHASISSRVRVNQ